MEFQLTKRIYVTLYQQWDAVLMLLVGRKCKWIDFTFIDLACEWTRNCEGWEVTAGLMGFRVWVRGSYDRLSDEVSVPVEVSSGVELITGSRNRLENGAGAHAEEKE